MATAYATRLHFAENGNGDNTSLNSGDGVIVHKIIFSNRTGGVSAVSFTDAASTPSELFELAFDDGALEDVDIMTFFDNGFTIPTLTNGFRLIVTWRPTG